MSLLSKFHICCSSLFHNLQSNERTIHHTNDMIQGMLERSTHMLDPDSKQSRGCLLTVTLEIRWYTGDFLQNNNKQLKNDNYNKQKITTVNKIIITTTVDKITANNLIMTTIINKK